MLSQIVPFAFGFVAVVMVLCLVINVVIAIKGGSQIAKAVRERAARHEPYSDPDDRASYQRCTSRRMRSDDNDGYTKQSRRRPYNIRPGHAGNSSPQVAYRRSQAQPVNTTPDLTILQPSQPAVAALVAQPVAVAPAAAPSTIPDHWATGDY